MSPWPPIAVLVCVCSLAACAGGAPSGGDVAARCRAAGAESVLGKELDHQVTQDALRASGALRSRVVRPGSAGTLEDPMRLNIEVDDSGRIRRLQCG
jgi:hypothetical protein